MSKTRLTKVVGEYARGVVSEDGVNYRHERQNMDPVLKHVDFLSEKVNQAPKRGNRNGWGYEGSIPTTILVDWCRKVGIGLDVYARDNHGEKAALLKHIRLNYPKFLAKKKKSSQVLMFPKVRR